MQYDMEMPIYELSNSMMQKKMWWGLTEMEANKIEFLFFSNIYLNMDILAAIRLNSSKFWICVHKILMEGSVSQSFWGNVEINVSKKCKKLPVFLHKI